MTFSLLYWRGMANLSAMLFFHWTGTESIVTFCCLGARGHTKYNGKQCSAPYYTHVLVFVPTTAKMWISKLLAPPSHSYMFQPKISTFTRPFRHPDFFPASSAHSLAVFTIHWKGMGTRQTATLLKSWEQARQSIAAQHPWPVTDDLFILAHAQIVHVLIVSVYITYIHPTVSTVLLEYTMHECIEPSLHGLDFFLEIFLWRLVSVLYW